MALTHTNGGDRVFATTPLYAQVQDWVLSRIGTGALAGQIPPESDLCREAGVSAGTMRKALDALEARGFLTRVQGRGTFIRHVERWGDLPDCTKTLLHVMAGDWEPSADPAARALCLRREPDATITADAFRTLADGAIEIAAWLDRRALEAGKEREAA
jgi:DNA-binding FadR family transcriptional regulator